MAERENKATMVCTSCDQEITTPGVGHHEKCRSPRSGVEEVFVHPAPFIIDEQGRYFANLEGGHKMIRRI